MRARRRASRPARARHRSQSRAWRAHAHDRAGGEGSGRALGDPGRAHAARARHPPVLARRCARSTSRPRAITSSRPTRRRSCAGSRARPRAPARTSASAHRVRAPGDGAGNCAIPGRRRRSALARRHATSASERNREFLVGVEAEYEGVAASTATACTAFSTASSRAANRLDRAGLQRHRADRPRVPPSAQARPARVPAQGRDGRGLSHARCLGHRGGLIPVGGPVSPMAAQQRAPDRRRGGPRVAAVRRRHPHRARVGMGGGAARSRIISSRTAKTPAARSRARAPRFAGKRALRALYDRGVPDAALRRAAVDAPLHGARALGVLPPSRACVGEGWRDLAQTLLRGQP